MSPPLPRGPPEAAWRARPSAQPRARDLGSEWTARRRTVDVSVSSANYSLPCDCAIEAGIRSARMALLPEARSWLADWWSPVVMTIVSPDVDANCVRSCGLRFVDLLRPFGRIAALNGDAGGARPRGSLRTSDGRGAPAPGRARTRAARAAFRRSARRRQRSVCTSNSLKARPSGRCAGGASGGSLRTVERAPALRYPLHARSASSLPRPLHFRSAPLPLPMCPMLSPFSPPLWDICPVRSTCTHGGRTAPL